MVFRQSLRARCIDKTLEPLLVSPTDPVTQALIALVLGLAGSPRHAS